MDMAMRMMAVKRKYMKKQIKQPYILFNLWIFVLNIYYSFNKF